MYLQNLTHNYASLESLKFVVNAGWVSAWQEVRRSLTPAKRQTQRLPGFPLHLNNAVSSSMGNFSTPFHNLKAIHPVLKSLHVFFNVPDTQAYV
jgi:hypothetical protein